MPDPMRLAIVGAGWTGQRHVEAARELGESIEVTALVDNDPEHLRTTAAEMGVERTTTDLHEILADPEIDAISICTPHALHAPMALDAASAGKHILVTKPMATSVVEATRMVDGAAAASVTLYVAEHLPYEPRFDTLRQIVETGEHIGELTFAACVAGHRARNPLYPGRRAWLTRPGAGGTGMWALLGIHTVAALRYVLGEVASIYMLDHHASSFERDDLEATMSGVVELESGVVVSLVQTTETQLRPLLADFRLYGDSGVVIGREETYDVFDGGDDEQPVTLPYPTEGLSAYARMLQAFIDAIGPGETGPTSGSSERRSLAVIEAGYESARSRRPIDLRERYPGIWDG